jgi:hypothetical protein
VRERDDHRFELRIEVALAKEIKFLAFQHPHVVREEKLLDSGFVPEQGIIFVGDVDRRERISPLTRGRADFDAIECETCARRVLEGRRHLAQDLVGG